MNLGTIASYVEKQSKLVHQNGYFSFTDHSYRKKTFELRLSMTLSPTLALAVPASFVNALLEKE